MSPSLYSAEGAPELPPELRHPPAEVVRSPNFHSMRQQFPSFQEDSPTHGLQKRLRQTNTLSNSPDSEHDVLFPGSQLADERARTAAIADTDALASLMLKPIRTKLKGSGGLKGAMSMLADSSPPTPWHHFKWCSTKVLVISLVTVALILASTQLFWALHYVHIPDACLPTYPTVASHFTTEHARGVSADPSDIPVDTHPRIAILTMHDSRREPVPADLASFVGLPAGQDADILDMVWRNRQAYASKHGYKLIDGSTLIDRSRPYSWSKIPITKAHLNSFDWLVWMDPDVWITNPDISLETLIPSQGHGDLVITMDATGFYQTGIFLLRSSDWSRRFLDDWWGMNSFSRKSGAADLGDTIAMREYVQRMPSSEFEARVQVPVQCAMNSYLWRSSVRQWFRYVIKPTAIAASAWRPAHLLLHLAGWQKVKGLRKLHDRTDWESNGSHVLPGQKGQQTSGKRGASSIGVNGRSRKFLSDSGADIDSSPEHKPSKGPRKLLPGGRVADAGASNCGGPACNPPSPKLARRTSAGDGFEAAQPIIEEPSRAVITGAGATSSKGAEREGGSEDSVAEGNADSREGRAPQGRPLTRPVHKRRWGRKAVTEPQPRQTRVLSEAALAHSAYVHDSHIADDLSKGAIEGPGERADAGDASQLEQDSPLQVAAESQEANAGAVTAGEVTRSVTVTPEADFADGAGGVAQQAAFGDRGPHSRLQPEPAVVVDVQMPAEAKQLPDPARWQGAWPTQPDTQAAVAQKPDSREQPPVRAADAALPQLSNPGQPQLAQSTPAAVHSAVNDVSEELHTLPDSQPQLATADSVQQGFEVPGQARKTQGLARRLSTGATDSDITATAANDGAAHAAREAAAPLVPAHKHTVHDWEWKVADEPPPAVMEGEQQGQRSRKMLV